jgi:predicted metal-binding protein
MRGLPANWSNAILVCAKCSKRQHGGFGPKRKTPLAKALRKQLHLKKGRKARAGIIEVKCLGVCPRDAVTVVNTRQPGLWRLVKPGTDVEAVVADLELFNHG